MSIPSLLDDFKFLIHTIRIISQTVLEKSDEATTMNDHWSPNFLVSKKLFNITHTSTYSNLTSVNRYYKFINMKPMKPKIFFLAAFPLFPRSKVGRVKGHGKNRPRLRHGGWRAGGGCNIATSPGPQDQEELGTGVFLVILGPSSVSITSPVSQSRLNFPVSV